MWSWSRSSRTSDHARFERSDSNIMSCKGIASIEGRRKPSSLCWSVVAAICMSCQNKESTLRRRVSQKKRKAEHVCTSTRRSPMWPIKAEDATCTRSSTQYATTGSVCNWHIAWLVKLYPQTEFALAGACRSAWAWGPVSPPLHIMLRCEQVP